jgi:hypothetical protein
MEKLSTLLNQGVQKPLEQMTPEEVYVELLRRKQVEANKLAALAALQSIQTILNISNTRRK